MREKRRITIDLENLYRAYEKLTENGGVHQYAIGSRSLTRADLQTIRAEIEVLEAKLDALEIVLAGRGRRGYRIIPRDW
jgi:hypothetical protein